MPWGHVGMSRDQEKSHWRGRCPPRLAMMSPESNDDEKMLECYLAGIQRLRTDCVTVHAAGLHEQAALGVTVTTTWISFF